MICVICKTGQYKEGITTVVLTEGETAVIIKGVPAMICDQCGEYVLTSDVTRKVLAMAREARDKGTEVEIRRFAA
jgi:YgiT-type zinc finger domain-containing protein